MTSLIGGLVRGVGLASLALVIGGLVLELLILPGGAADLAVARRRLRRAITASLVVLLVTTLADLVVRTQAMSGASPAGALAFVPEVVTRTHLGAILSVRAAALALAVLLSLTRAAAHRVLSLLIALGVALTATLTGHAADWGDLTAAVVIDWAHLAVASAWTGGLIALALVVFRAERAWPPESAAILAGRFSRLAGACLLVVGVTGGYNAWTQLGALSRLWSTSYGRVLLVKVLLVAALAGLGALNRYVVVARLVPGRAARGVGGRAARMGRLVIFGPRGGGTAASASARLTAFVTGEATIALAVFACTAALGEITPGRHVSFERKMTTHVPPVQRGSAGAGRGAVTPPPGNAARGRAVFVKLQCFTCHAVRAERFPAPSRPGPDLAGVGSRQAGYLLESVLNPNALIIDGPGYVDANGLSIMPDYRDRMTVTELIDVVAYLKGLEDVIRSPSLEAR